MLGSTVLETVIGVVLIFLVMSLLCSAIREAWEAVFKQRALDLERGIRELLHDRHGDGLARELYSHPLVHGLFLGRYKPTESATFVQRWFGRGGQLPSYIPSENFARALIDLEQQGRVDNPAIVGVLRALAQETGDDVARLRANVQTWFDSSTDRISGWYKRRTQALLLVFGFVLALAMNVNPLVIASTLFQESDIRAAVVATAQTMQPNAQYQANVRQLHELAAAGVPMGWRAGPARDAAWFLMPFGWLLTALAVTLGAPFWFDLLNKFVVVRSTIKPKSASTPSDKPDTNDVRPVVDAKAVVGGDVARVNRSSVPLPLVAAGFEPHSWQNGEEDGVL